MKTTTTFSGVRKSNEMRWLKLLLAAVIGTVLLSTPAAVWSSDPVEYGYRDFSYPGGTGGNSEPTGEKPESKLWWNDGYWWGSLWSTQGDAYHIYRLHLATQSWVDTGTALDDRSDSRADTLWDGQHLYVVSHVFAKNAGAPAPPGERGELYRYSYDSATKSYSLDAGFPVEVTGGKSETLVLEKDSNGQLWVTYVEDQKVMLNHSLNGDDLQWRTPFALPANEANVSSDDISSIITYNQHVGVMWSNQNSPKEMYFAVHPVGAPDTTWTPVRAYSVSGDDHISLKSLEADSEGNVYAAIKTSRNAELIVVLVCERNVNRCKTESDWSSYPVYDGTHSPTRPILLIDTSNRELNVFTRNKDANGDSGIYYKTASLDNIQFAEGIGTPFIKSATETGINDPTSTKQNLTSTTGMVVLASDGDYYFHNYKSLSGSAIQHALTVNTVGSGTVTLDPPGGVYDEGTTVSLTATADAGWTFDGWSGDLTGTDNPTTITMDSDKSVTATFTSSDPDQQTLTVGVVGTGSVELDPAGGVYDLGQMVTMTATAGSGWTFSGWSGDLTGTDNPVTITMDADKAVTATFDESGNSGEVIYRETVAGSSSGSTSVSTNQPLTAASGDLYLAAISTKSNVSVQSVSGLGLTWTPVRAQCAGRDQTGVAVWMAQGTPSSNDVVSATLAEAPSNAVIAVTRYSGVASDTPIGAIVSGNTNGVDGGCSSGTDSDSYSFALTTTKSGSVVYGATAIRNKTHQPGIGFLERIEVSEGSGGNVASVAVQDKTVASPTTTSVDGTISSTTDWAVIGLEIKPEIVSEPEQYTIVTTTVGAGSVTLDPLGGVYDEGTLVELTATADPGWTFSGWSGDLTGTDNPASLTMDADKSVTATFTQDPLPQYTLTVNAVGAGSVTLDPAGGVYDEGTTVSLTATADPGWSFSGWSGDLTGTDNPTTITMDADKSVTATFTEETTGGGDTVTYEETQTGSSASSSTVSTSAPLTAASGDLYLASIAAKKNTTVLSVSGLGLSWTEVQAQCAGRNQTGVAVWMALGSPSGDDVVTATLADSPNNAVIAVSRYSGVDAAAPLGNVVSGNTNGAGGTCSGGSDSASYSFDLATSVSGSVVYGAAAIRNNNHEAGTDFLERAEVAQGSGGSVAAVAVQDKTVPSPSTTSVDGTISSTTDWAVIGLEIKPGAG